MCVSRCRTRNCGRSWRSARRTRSRRKRSPCALARTSSTSPSSTSAPRARTSPRWVIRFLMIHCSVLHYLIEYNLYYISCIHDEVMVRVHVDHMNNLMFSVCRTLRVSWSIICQRFVVMVCAQKIMFAISSYTSCSWLQCSWIITTICCRLDL